MDKNSFDTIQDFLVLDLPDDLETLERIQKAYKEQLKQDVINDNATKFFMHQENLSIVERKIKRLKSQK